MIGQRAGGWLRNMIKSWLQITEGNGQGYSVISLYDYEGNAIKNRIWYRGDPYELRQFYAQVHSDDASFWSVAPSAKMLARKMHTGLPALIVDTLTDITISGMDAIKVSSMQDEIDAILQENNIKKLMTTMVSNMLYLGDGAIKISIDTLLSDYPILEWYPGDKVDFIYKRGRLQEIVFKNYYVGDDTKKYVHYEHYGYGYIKNELRMVDTNKPVPMHTIPSLKDVQDYSFGGYTEDSQGNMCQKGSYMMAIPAMLKESSKFSGRGESIFDKKTSSFDALDEIVSQWIDAIRLGRAKEYIPDSLIPRKEDNGLLLKPNPFDSQYIKIGGQFEDGNNQINVVQPTIPSNNYLESYMTFLNDCLEGLISPASLGIDTKKLDNADAQREKEKTTLETRKRIIAGVSDIVTNIVRTSLQVYSDFNGMLFPDELTVEINFGEYANPSFEAVIETVVKGRQGQVMSIRAALDELYKNTKSDDWKEEEEERIKEENGITQTEEVTESADAFDDDALDEDSLPPDTNQSEKK